MDLKEPSPLVEAGIEQQACLGLYRFHEAECQLLIHRKLKIKEHDELPHYSTSR